MTMKKTMVLLLLSFPFLSSGQDKKLFDILPVTNGKVNYHDTVHLDNKSLVNLENKITKWYAVSYKRLAKFPDKESIDDRSLDTGIIRDYFVIKWKQPSWSKRYDAGANNLKVYVWHSIKLIAFENGYYYEITNFKIIRNERKSFLKPFPSNVDVTPENMNSATTDEKAKIVSNEIDEEVKKIISSLEQFMKS